MRYPFLAILLLSGLPAAGAENFNFDQADPVSLVRPQLDAARRAGAAKTGAVRAAAALPASDLKPGRYRIAFEGLAYAGLLTQRYKFSGTFVVGDRNVNLERILTDAQMTLELLPEPAYGLSGATLSIPQAGCRQPYAQYMNDRSGGSDLVFEMQTCLRGVKTGSLLDSRLEDTHRFLLWPFCSQGLSGCRMGMLSGFYIGDLMDIRLNATADTFPIAVEPVPATL